MSARRAAQGVAVALALLIIVFGQAASALAVDATHSWWLATGLGAGAISPDQNLANYRWDTRPATLYGAQAAVGRGRVAAGLRYSRWGTTQGTGLLQGGPDPQVRLDTFELVGQYRLAEVAGIQLWGTALAGRVGLSYTPDQVIIDDSGAGDITVNYAPITETSLGLGLELKREFGRKLTAALQAERSGFHLDTNHRRGDEIVSARENFANWSLRLQVSWLVPGAISSPGPARRGESQ